MEQRSTKSSWLENLRTVFGVDPRSLAVFRIMLGIIILADILLRLPNLGAFTTDAGILDREAAARFLQMDYGSQSQVTWSLNFLSGELWLQQLLLGLLALAAVSLALGFWTRLATIVCWVLIVSVHMRFSIILSSGDTLLRSLLFWSMFAPLGHCWSLDARRADRFLDERPPKILTGGTAGLISQMIIMYFFAGIAKWNDFWWQGDAMNYVLRLDIYARPWAQSLLAYPLMLKVISWATLFGEVFLILFLLVPWRNTWWRIINLGLYVVLHLSIATTMNIGLFSYISIVGWLPILPAVFWNARLWNRWNWDINYPTDGHADPAPEIVVASVNQRDWWGGVRLIGNSFASFMIVYVLLWNVGNLATGYDGDLQQRLNWSPEQYQAVLQKRRGFAVAMPAPLRWIGLVTGTAQHFQMFGVPPLYSPWFVYHATLKDGTEIDLLRQRPVSYERPESTLHSIPGHHWRKLHRNCLSPPLQDVRPKIAEYLIRRWDTSHREGKQIRSLRVTCYMQKTGPQYQDENPEPVIWYDTATRRIDSLDDLDPDLLLGL